MNSSSDFSTSSQRAAFSFVELLTVIAMTGVFAAIVITGVGNVRTNAANSRNTNQVHTCTTAAEKFNLSRWW